MYPDQIRVEGNSTAFFVPSPNLNVRQQNLVQRQRVASVTTCTPVLVPHSDLVDLGVVTDAALCRFWQSGERVRIKIPQI